ncbi:MAG TPA: hypothetical protein PK156_32070, partial [Polyangium sp.]|nr:hypothetical protein [Polyangium sp.]
GGGGGGGGGGDVEPAQKYCNAVGPAYCGALFACCPNPDVLGNEGVTLDGCLERWRTECPLWIEGEVGPLLADGRSVLDEAHLNQCVQTLSEMKVGGAACDEPPRIVKLFTCWSAFHGQVMPGQPCGVSSSDISYVECAEGYCDQAVCKSYRQLGDSCNPSADLCNRSRGEVCAFDGTTATCKQAADIGGTCFYTPVANWACKSLTCSQNNMCDLPSADYLCAGN